MGRKPHKPKPNAWAEHCPKCTRQGVFGDPGRLQEVCFMCDEPTFIVALWGHEWAAVVWMESRRRALCSVLEFGFDLTIDRHRDMLTKMLEPLKAPEAAA